MLVSYDGPSSDASSTPAPCAAGTTLYVLETMMSGPFEHARVPLTLFCQYSTAGARKHWHFLD